MDVTVTNRRADNSTNEDLTKLARHGADAFGYRANLRIDRKLSNSSACGCLRSTTAPTASTSTTRPHATPAPRPLIDTLTAWWETDFHDDAARAALAYTEAITRVADATLRVFRVR